MFALGVILLVVAAMGIVGFLLQRHRSGRLGNTPVVSTRDAATRGEAVAGPKGVISAQGKVAVASPLISPVTQTPCLFYFTKVTAEWKAGDSSQSVTVSEAQKAVPISLDDGSGAVDVVLSNLDVGDYKQIFSKSNKMGLLNVLDGATLKYGDKGFTVIAGTPGKNGERVPQSAEYKVEEWALPVLDQAFVSGKSENGKIVAPKWVSLIVSSKSRDELLAKTATMMKRTKYLSLATGPIGAVVTVVALLVGGGSKLQKEEEVVDLTPSGMKATLTVPRGSTLEASQKYGPARLVFGNQKDVNSPELALFGQRISKLECPSTEKGCEVIEKSDGAVLYAVNKGRTHKGIVHLKFSDEREGECDVTAQGLGDARRLLKSCQTVVGVSHIPQGSRPTEPASEKQPVPAQKRHK